jgi:hypothetical protein
MSEMELNEVKRALADAYDADELVDVLKIEAWEILERFEDKVIDYAEERPTEESEV